MISIIIPTLNEEKIIRRTFTGLASLTIPHEIIVSDGKSKDQTVAIAREYTPHVVEYHGETRQTIAMGRNAGGQIAQGDFLVFLDADCSVKNPDAFFKVALANFEQDKKLVALTGQLRVLPEMERLSDYLVFNYMNLFFRVMNNFFHIGLSPGEFQMMKREAFENVAGYRRDLVASEDTDMFFRLSKIGRTRLDPKLTIFHTGRRARTIGWPRLLWNWFINFISVFIFHKSKSPEWTPIR